MGLFFKALAAIVTADAIDRHARGRPTRYWHPTPPKPPAGGRQEPRGPAPRQPFADPTTSAWDLEHPERPA